MALFTIHQSKEFAKVLAKSINQPQDLTLAEFVEFDARDRRTGYACLRVDLRGTGEAAVPWSPGRGVMPPIAGAHAKDRHHRCHSGGPVFVRHTPGERKPGASQGLAKLPDHWPQSVPIDWFRQLCQAWGLIERLGS